MIGNALSVALGILFLPVTVLGSFVVVHPQEEKVVLMWGRFVTILTKPGMYWINLFGRRIVDVSRRQQTLELPKNTVADGNGNPIIVSGIVTFTYADAQKVALEVEDAHEFVRTQAMAVLKQVASKYPYESKDGLSLKSEAARVGIELVDVLQRKVAPAGTKVLSFELSDLAYSPEIAQSMLIRQQASALVDARKIIVEGAVSIVNDAVELLEEKKLHLTEENRQKLVANLLTVICGESKVQPTMQIAGADSHENLGPLLERLMERMRPANGAQSS